MKLLIASVLIALSLLSIGLHAQINDFVWAKSAGGPGADYLFDIEIDQAGNQISVGNFEDSVTFDLITGSTMLVAAGYNDAYAMKSDQDGNPLWVVSLNGSGSENVKSAKVDLLGNIILTGFFEGSCDFDPSPDNSFVLISAGSVDAFIWKLNSDGELIWAKNFGGTFYDSADAVDIDTENNIIVSGVFDYSADLDPDPTNVVNFTAQSEDIYIMKLTSDGETSWIKQIASDNYMLMYKMVCDHNGDVLISGAFTDATDFNPGPATFNLTPAVTAETFILKLDNDGNFQWVYHLDGCAFFGLGVNQENEVLSTGRYTNMVDFDPGPGTSNLSGSDEIFAVKLNSNGQFQWCKGFIGDYSNEGNGIVADPYGNIYLVGEFSGQVDFDPGSGTENLVATGNNSDVFVVKLTDEGELIWAKGAGGTSEELGIEIIVDANENIFVGGFSTSDPMIFDDIQLLNNSDLPYQGDFYYCKIGTCATSGYLTTSACDNYTSPGGVIVTTLSGTYLDVLPNAMGCDSLLQIDLQMYYSTAASFSPDVCHAYTSPSGLYTWTSSGIYYDTIPNIAGCDSLLTFSLEFTDDDVTQTGQTLSADQSDAIYQWLLCNDNYSQISGADEQVYQVTSNGSYAVEITINGCSDTSACFTYTDISVPVMVDDKFSIYPNPVSSQLHIASTSIINSWVLYDLRGSVIKNQQNIQSKTTLADISNIAEGQYILETNTTTGVWHDSIIILRE